MKNSMLLSGIMILLICANSQAQKIDAKATTLKSRADSLSHISQYDSANVRWKQAAELFLKSENYAQYVQCLNEIGYSQTVLGQYEKSDSTLNKTLEEGKKLLGESSSEVGKSYYYIAGNQVAVGHYDQGRENMKKALMIALKNKNRLEEGVVLNGLGRICFFQSDYNKALTYFSQSLEIFEEEDSDTDQMVGGYMNIGTIFLMKGQYMPAVKHYEKALSFIPQEIQSLLKAGIYNNIGYSLFEMGEMERALMYYQKSLSMRVDLLGEVHPQIATSISNIGNVFYKNNKIDEALIQYRKALEIRKELLKPDHPDIGRNLMNIGLMYHILKQYTEAENYLKESLQLLSSGAGPEHQYTGDVYLNLGMTLKAQGKLELARNAFERAIEIFEMTDSRNDIISTRVQLAYMEDSSLPDRLKNCEMALERLFPDQDTKDYKSLVSTVSSSDYSVLLKIFKAYAYVLEALNDQNSQPDHLKSALILRKLSVNLMDKMRLNYRSDISRIYNDEPHRSVYEKGVEISLKLYEADRNPVYREDAFWFMEKGKASVLFTSLTESKAKKIGGINQDILMREQRLKEELTWIENEINAADEENKEELRDELFQLKRTYDSFRDSIKTSFPGYHLLTQQVDVIGSSEIQSRLNAKTAIVEYFLSDSMLTIAIIRKDNFKIVKKKKRETFEANLENLYRSINKRDKQKFLKLSGILHKDLIQPISQQLDGVEELIIVPHADLWYLPFESLVVNNPEGDLSRASYLLSEYIISYHYSSTILFGQESTDYQENKSILAFAPVFDEESRNENLSSSDTLQYAHFYNKENRHDYIRHLPESKKEVTEIAKLFRTGNHEASVFIGKESTEEHFKKESDSYTFLHLATHSFINEEKPDYSGIYFSKPDTTRKQNDDGILFSGELYNLNLKSDVVVLSSCESGIGKAVKGEGMLSLSRGFYYSGAKQIIYSLWKVYDKSTRDLMVKFYRHVLDGKPVEIALRKAKLEMLENKATSFPKYWAGFVLLGK
ncbi:MAG: CHAT domain-containing tetratricopeptide repeat protein [Cyclobacteriaceae bacterium]